MEAIDYLNKVNVICKLHSDGNCYNKCPLFDIGCGIPKEQSEIEKAIELVANFKINELSPTCPTCEFNFVSNGSSIKEINFCPICGTKRERT